MDIGQWQRDNAKRMKRNIARTKKETDADRRIRHQEVCRGCRFSMGVNDKYDTYRFEYCDCTSIMGHTRPCSPVDCVACGVWEPKTEETVKERQRPATVIPRVREAQ